jgi:hypothetical protein
VLACVLQFYKANGIEWPTVTVEYKDINVSMDVSSGAGNHMARAAATNCMYMHACMHACGLARA